MIMSNGVAVEDASEELKHYGNNRCKKMDR